MKFYIGIVPPIVTKERIFEFQKSFPSNKVPYFNEPHITLKAPSRLSEDKAWLAPIMTLVGNYSPFKISIEGLDQFDDAVLFLQPAYSEELLDLHNKLIDLLDPDIEAREKFFEGPLYHPHLTLGETTRGGMTKEEFVEMKKRAEFELYNIPSFHVTSVRLYQKPDGEELYSKLLDIPLKL
jgi:2'-5' RNA ligase